MDRRRTRPVGQRRGSGFRPHGSRAGPTASASGTCAAPRTRAPTLAAARCGPTPSGRGHRRPRPAPLAPDLGRPGLPPAASGHRALEPTRPTPPSPLTRLRSRLPPEPRATQPRGLTARRAVGLSTAIAWTCGSPDARGLRRHTYSCSGRRLSRIPTSRPAPAAPVLQARPAGFRPRLRRRVSPPGSPGGRAPHARARPALAFGPVAPVVQARPAGFRLRLCRQVSPRGPGANASHFVMRASRPGPASPGLRLRRSGTPGPVGGRPVVSVSGGRTPDVRVAGALRLLVPRLLIAPDCGCSASGVGLSRRPGPTRHSEPLHSGTPAPAGSRSWPAPDSGLPVAVMSAPVVVSAVPETFPLHPRPAPGWNV